jgi:enoyl-[acyl-carrier-protein] reductase (NADH)
LRCAVAVASDLESLATAVAASSDSVSVLVHCAVDAVNGPLTEIGVDRLNAALAVSATSLLGAVTAFGPMLVPGSAVIYLTSVGGQRVVRDYGAVGVAKAAGEALVRYLASELAVGGVRVNAVSAGPVDTGALQIMTGDVAAVLASSARRSPMRRNVTTAEVSDMVVMLTGPRSTAVTGQIVTVDTGLFLA